MLHLGAGPLCGRTAQIVHTLQLVWRLTTDRANYSYVLMYNFYLPIFLAGVYAKYVLGKALYVEYQDDYTKRRKNRDQESIGTHATQDLLRGNLRERAYGFFL